jgi:hypothetical protein
VVCESRRSAQIVGAQRHRLRETPQQRTKRSFARDVAQNAQGPAGFSARFDRAKGRD